MKCGFDISQTPSTGDVEVGWGQVRMASDEAILSTDGLAVCIGVGIYDPVASTGYLAHMFPVWKSYLETVVPMVEAVQAQAAERSKLLAWVRGGTLTTADIQEYNTQQVLRTLTLDVLANIGIDGDRLDVEWNDNAHRTVSMALCCVDGTMMAVRHYKRSPRDKASHPRDRKPLFETLIAHSSRV